MNQKPVLDEKKLLCPLEVASLLSISSKRVLYLCRSGLLPYFDFAGQIRVEEKDLAEYVGRSHIISARKVR